MALPWSAMTKISGVSRKYYCRILYLHIALVLVYNVFVLSTPSEVLYTMEFGLYVSDCKKIRLVVCADCSRESSAPFALTHILLTPKFDTRGVVSSHFGKAGSRIDSCNEAKKVVEHLELDKDVPVIMGAAKALDNEFTPENSEGSSFIVREANSKDLAPLHILCIGPLTDVASAILTDPSIAPKLTITWVGCPSFPEGGYEKNLENDICAANAILDCKSRLRIITAAATKAFTISLAELEYRANNRGAAGCHLYNHTLDCFESTTSKASDEEGECWNVDAMAGPAFFLKCHETQIIPAPRISDDMKYIDALDGKPVAFCQWIDARFTIEDFFAKLSLQYPLYKRFR
jgi:inosine-uridine nucleoside N-ribohydrolase